MSVEAGHYKQCAKFFNLKCSGDIQWGHRVNTIALLQESISRGDHFLEIDLFHSEVAQGPVLVHAHHDISDWSQIDQFVTEGRVFSTWLDELVRLLSLAKRKVGVKLDFKMIDPVVQAMQIINAREEQLKEFVEFVWINADVLQGPRGPACKFVDSEDDGKVSSLSDFMNVCDSFKFCGSNDSVVISIGWTTGGVTNEQPLGYSAQHIQEMIQLLDKYKLHNRQVTFPIRGVDAVASMEQLDTLLQLGVHWSLTIWVGEESLKPDQIDTLITHFGLDRLFIDIPGYVRK
jgi:hypothetical protein